MSKKAKIVIAVVILAAAAAVGGYLMKDKLMEMTGGNEAAYVQSVQELMGTNSGVQNRYAGVVETQDTWDVKLSQDQKVKELFVQVGDVVEEGTELFEYDLEDLKLQLSTAQLELEEMGNAIISYKKQISALEAEKKQASKDEQFSYTTEIQSLETSIKQTEYNQEAKKLEIQKLQENADQSVVTSKVAGVVKSINEDSRYDNYGNELPFISVMSAGDYRVKAKISENNVWMINEGDPVILRSRIDENQTWTGVIETIDMESTVSDENSYYGGDSGEKASKYPFYVALDSSEGLLLGQHIYVEMNNGQEEAKEGLYLYTSYIVFDEDGSTYCWADNGEGKLEKRLVELGEYDMNMDSYQILFGIVETDLIAWPQNCYSEGMKTTQNIDEAIFDDMIGDDSDGDSSEDGYAEGDSSEDGYIEEDIYDTGVSAEGTSDEEAVGEAVDDELYVEEGAEEDMTEGSDAAGDAEQ